MCKTYRATLARLLVLGDTFDGVHEAQKGWRFPIQWDFSVTTLLGYWTTTTPSLTRIRSPPSMSDVLKDDRSCYPLKHHPGAATKVNLFLRDVLESSRKYGQNEACVIAGVALGKAAASVSVMYNDTACGFYMWAYTAVKYLSPAHIYAIAERFMDESAMKSLSNLVKTSGTAAAPEKCLLCELNALYGRMSGEVDWDTENKFRTDMNTFLSVKGAVMDKDKLRNAINYVYRHEIKKVPNYPSVETYWTRRWIFTKSGGHQRRIEKMLYGRYITGGDNVTRRHFAEAAQECVLLKTKPAVYAGYSTKLEAGKSRALYGADTVSYYHFDYILRELEREWHNKSALLQPSKGDTVGEYCKIAKNSEHVHVMMDYDDFNSQHEEEAKWIVFDELRKFMQLTGDAADVMDWCCDSIKNEYIAHPDGRLEKTVGTLLSGHRATTFINTILNKAYLMVVLGEYYTDRMLHAGDDVYVSFNDYDTAERCLNLIAESPLRMNPSKQAVGTVSGEFLRASFTRTHARGYVARAISSTVAGNWVNEHELGSEEYAKNILGLVWTHTVRASNDSVWALYMTSFMRRCVEFKHYARPLLTFQYSLGTSPVRSEIQRFVRLVPSYRRSKVRISDHTACHATQDYLDHHVDHKLLKLAEISAGEVRKLMLEASYSSCYDTDVVMTDLTTQMVRPTRSRYSHTLNKEKGVLESLFPFTYFQGRLTKQQLHALMRALGYDDIIDIKHAAWAQSVYTPVVPLSVPWGVANMWGRALTSVCRVTPTFNVYV